MDTVTIVGLPDKAIKEASERVRAARAIDASGKVAASSNGATRARSSAYPSSRRAIASMVLR